MARVLCIPGDVTCGKRALEAGDTLSAALTFAFAENLCDRVFGVFLSRVIGLYNFRLNAELYYDDTFGPLHNAGFGVVLATQAGFVAAMASVNAELAKLLGIIRKRNCTLTAEDGGPLRIPYRIGPCWSRNVDGILVGIWDAADAYFMYAGLIPITPPLGHRTVLVLSACDPAEKFFCTCETDDDPDVPPAPCDAQLFTLATENAAALFAQPGRDGHVFQWIDADGSGILNQGDPYVFNYLDLATGEPVVESEGVTVLPRWTPQVIEPQEGEEFRVCTYCPEGEPCYGAPGCNPSTVGTALDNCTPGPSECIDIQGRSLSF